jgi:hypothetical protein
MLLASVKQKLDAAAVDQFPASSRFSKEVEEADEERDDMSNSRRKISMLAS